MQPPLVWNVHLFFQVDGTHILGNKSILFLPTGRKVEEKPFLFFPFLSFCLGVEVKGRPAGWIGSAGFIIAMWEKEAYYIKRHVTRTPSYSAGRTDGESAGRGREKTLEDTKDIARRPEYWRRLVSCYMWEVSFVIECTTEQAVSSIIHLFSFLFIQTLFLSFLLFFKLKNIDRIFSHSKARDLDTILLLTKLEQARDL